MFGNAGVDVHVKRNASRHEGRGRSRPRSQNKGRDSQSFCGILLTVDISSSTLSTSFFGISIGIMATRRGGFPLELGLCLHRAPWSTVGELPLFGETEFLPGSFHSQPGLVNLRIEGFGRCSLRLVGLQRRRGCSELLLEQPSLVGEGGSQLVLENKFANLALILLIIIGNRCRHRGCLAAGLRMVLKSLQRGVVSEPLRDKRSNRIEERLESLHGQGGMLMLRHVGHRRTYQPKVLVDRRVPLGVGLGGQVSGQPSSTSLGIGKPLPLCIEEHLSFPDLILSISRGLPRLFQPLFGKLNCAFKLAHPAPLGHELKREFPVGDPSRCFGLLHGFFSALACFLQKAFGRGRGLQVLDLLVKGPGTARDDRSWKSRRHERFRNIVRSRGIVNRSLPLRLLLGPLGLLLLLLVMIMAPR